MDPGPTQLTDPRVDPLGILLNEEDLNEEDEEDVDDNDDADEPEDLDAFIRHLRSTMAPPPSASDSSPATAPPTRRPRAIPKARTATVKDGMPPTKPAKKPRSLTNPTAPSSRRGSAATSASGDLDLNAHQHTDPPPTYRQIRACLDLVSDLLRPTSTPADGDAETQGSGALPFAALDLMCHLMEAVTLHLEPLGLAPDNTAVKLSAEDDDAAATFAVRREDDAAAVKGKRRGMKTRLFTYEDRTSFWREVNSRWLIAVAGAFDETVRWRTLEAAVNSTADAVLNPTATGALSDGSTGIDPVTLDPTSATPSEAQESFMRMMSLLLESDPSTSISPLPTPATTSPTLPTSEPHARERARALTRWWEPLTESVGAWGDLLEWYGLVDYECGFWESDLIEAIAMGRECVGRIGDGRI
ncbi:hypothetical protein HK101_004445 [Irineochytrium annulatum]|nr:hypothetical protein HK101_004445 [Irineochytrium annulatum]